MPTQPCPACLGTWPRRDQRIADCGLTIAYLFEDQYFPGWTVLVLKRHATELFQMTTAERGQLIEEVSRVAQALATVYQPVKLNYELLGNQVPHMHWHVIPRLPADPAPREPVWKVPHDPVKLTPEVLQRRIAELAAQLTR